MVFAAGNQITCIAIHFGGAATLLSKYKDDRTHYKEAIKVCTEMRFRPEIALTDLQLVELLLERYLNVVGSNPTPATKRILALFPRSFRRRIPAGYPPESHALPQITGTLVEKTMDRAEFSCTVQSWNWTPVRL